MTGLRHTASIAENLHTAISFVEFLLESIVRDAIRAEFSAIEPYDQLELEHLTDALAWIDSGAELCRISKPAIPAKHLVSYFVVVDHSHILLVDHKNAQLWLPTGGHVKPGEHPRATVRRELREELGVALAEELGAPFMVTCTQTVGLTAGHTDVSLWYLVHSHREQSLSFDEQEFNTVSWFKFNEVPFERSDPHMKRFVDKLCNYASTNRTSLEIVHPQSLEMRNNLLAEEGP